MQKWEYKIVIVYVLTDEAASMWTHHLNSLGAEGWELARMCPHDSGHKAALFFKRPLK